MLAVASLVIVMSVMNGFRAELLDKIIGLNGHAIIQGYDNRLDELAGVLEEVRATPGVVRATSADRAVRCWRPSTAAPKR